MVAMADTRMMPEIERQSGLSKNWSGGQSPAHAEEAMRKSRAG
jgi:hypothetical protein